MIIQVALAMVQLIFLLTVKPFATPLMHNIELMNETFTLLIYYTALGMNTEWIPDRDFVTGIGYMFTALILTVITLHLVLLFRTMFVNYTEKLFRKRGKANLCAIYTCLPFSRKLREQRRRINHLRWDREF